MKTVKFEMKLCCFVQTVLQRMGPIVVNDKYPVISRNCACETYRILKAIRLRTHALLLWSRR